MQPDQSPGVFGWRENFAAVYLIARCLECVWTIPLRTGHGIQYPRLLGLACLLVMMMVATRADDPEPVATFGLVWLALLVVRRVEARALFRQGVPLASGYSGYPGLLLAILPLGSETRAKNVEPYLCGGVAWAVMRVAPSLGALLMAGAVALWVTRRFDAYANFQRVVVMRDAAVQMRQAAMRCRGGWDEF